MNAPKDLETRRNELVAKLRNDPSVPAQPKFTHQEMRDVAQRLVTAALTGKPVS